MMDIILLALNSDNEGQTTEHILGLSDPDDKITETNNPLNVTENVGKTTDAGRFVRSIPYWKTTTKRPPDWYQEYHMRLKFYDPDEAYRQRNNNFNNNH